MVNPKARMGRPPLRNQDRRVWRLSVRCTEVEHREVERCAKAAGLPLSEWVRRVVLRALAGDTIKGKGRRPAE